MYNFINLRKLYGIVHGIMFLSFLLIFLVYGGHASLASEPPLPSVAGVVRDVTTGEFIEGATVTINNGTNRFVNCARFDFTYVEMSYQGPILGFSSIWLAPGVGIVKQTRTQYYYPDGLSIDTEESNVGDFVVYSNETGARLYLPLHDDVSLDFSSTITDNGEDYTNNSYSLTSTADSELGEGYWYLAYDYIDYGDDVEFELYIQGDYVYIDSYELLNFLFPSIYQSTLFAKPAPRPLAKVGKAAAVQRTFDAQRGISWLQVFRFNRFSGYEWIIENGYDDYNGSPYTITGKFVGYEPVKINNWTAETDGEGNYALLSGIATGSYTVTASCFGYLPSVEKSVAVSAGTTKTIDFYLKPMQYYRTVVSVAEAASMGIINRNYWIGL